MTKFDTIRAARVACRRVVAIGADVGQQALRHE